MENNKALLQATGLLAILISGIIVILSIESGFIQLVLSLLWLCLFLIAGLYFKYSTGIDELLPAAMYLFVASTFLNQSLLQVDVGFFSLFLYRLILIAVLLIFAFYLFRNGGLSDEWEQVQVKGILYFFLFWMAYGLVSLIWSRSVEEGVKYLFLLGIGIIFVFLSTLIFRRFNQVFIFYGIWSMMTIVLLVIGLLNHFAKIQLPTSTLYDGPDYKLMYPTAVFTNQNDFATFLTISFFFYLAAAKNSGTYWLKTGALFLSGLSVYLIYLTESRASLLGIAAGLAFYLYLLMSPAWKKRSLVAGAVVLFCGLIAYADRIVAKINGLLTAESHSLNTAVASNDVRVNLLQNTLHYVTDTYGFGVGAGNLPVYLKYEPIYGTNQIYEVHNWLAEIFGQFGLLVALGYLTVYLLLVLGLYQMRDSCTGERKWLIEALLTALVAFIVSSISPSSVSNLYFHWVFLGLVVATLSVLRRESAERKSADRYRRPASA